jgi:hypothetical protein
MSADDNKDEEEEYSPQRRRVCRERREVYVNLFPASAPSAPPRRNYGCFFTRKGTKSKAATKSIKRRHHEDHEGHEVYIRSFVAFASFVVRPSYEYGD